MGFYQNLLKSSNQTYLRDYTHASKTFRTNMYENSPKFKFLYHTEFYINSTNAFGLSNPNFGVLVRDIKLPSFKIESKEYNQYNRKRIIQSKIKYDPISISFHDDNGNLINKLWVAYYTYYYKDGSNPNVVFTGDRGNQTDLSIANPNSTFAMTNNTLTDYNKRTQYSNSSEYSESGDWGYYGEVPYGESGNPAQKVPFFKNITIFGFHQHAFIAYTLINPIITSFAHDTYNYEEGNGTMKNTMTLDYETVVYNEGVIDGETPSNIISTFGLESYYDRRLSPIAEAGSNRNSLGQGSLINSDGGSVTTMTPGSAIAASTAADVAYQTRYGSTLQQNANSELDAMLRNSVVNTPNTRNVQYYFPGAFTSPGPAGLAGSPTINAVQSPINITNTITAGTQIST